jgi:DNA-binding LacI/PurR family transcriptional regulator
MKIRISDIAAAAGVSPATVSNVFNGRKGVGQAMQQHILEVARQMGYVREMPSKSLRNCIRFVMVRTHGLVIMDTPFFSSMIEGIEQECHRSGYELLIASINLRDSDSMERVSDIINDATTPLILLATEMDDEAVKLFSRAKSPMVVMDRDCTNHGITSVTLDNINAGIAAARLLIQHGHRDIGYIASSAPFQNGTRRLNGLMIALYEAGLALKPENVLRVEPTLNGACRDMLTIIDARRTNMPTAFFCMNDLVAAGANRAFKEKGYSLPEDVSLVGMDDTPICSIIHPALTSINVDKAGFGRLAVQQLLYIIEQPPVRPINVVVSSIPAIRDSVNNRSAK